MRVLYRVNCGNDVGQVYSDKLGRQWLPDQKLGPRLAWGALEGHGVWCDDQLPPIDADAPELYCSERYLKPAPSTPCSPECHLWASFPQRC